MVVDYFILTSFFEQKNKIIPILENTIEKYKLELFLSSDHIFPFTQEKLEKHFQHKKNSENLKFIPSIFLECFYKGEIYPITVTFENFKSIEKNKKIKNFLFQEVENRKTKIIDLSNELQKKYDLIYNYVPNSTYSIFNISRNILLNNENIINFKIDKYLLGTKSERPILNLTKDILSFKLDSYSTFFTDLEQLFELLNTTFHSIKDNNVKVFLNILSGNYKKEQSKYLNFDFSGIILEKNDFIKIKDDVIFNKIKKFPASYFISEKFSPTISAGLNVTT